MPRKTWIYTADGRTIEKGTPEHAAYEAERYGDAPLVFSDEGSFVSPIDGKVYSGKTGMREHNKRHDVINHRDLVGLPAGINADGKSLSAQPSTRERQRVRETIAEVARAKGYLHGQ